MSIIAVAEEVSLKGGELHFSLGMRTNISTISTILQVRPHDQKLTNTKWSTWFWSSFLSWYFCLQELFVCLFVFVRIELECS